MNQRVLCVYKYILAIFLLTLAVLIIIPFFFCKALIPFVWGNNHLRNVISSSTINLLIGLIASAALAYLTALISYQNEIKQEEISFLSDVYQIEMLCSQAVAPEAIDQIIYFFTVYQQRQNEFIRSKKYKKKFLRKRMDKTKIEGAIENIEKSIESIQATCIYILRANWRVRSYQDQCILIFSQYFSSSEEEALTSTDLKNHINQIERLKEKVYEEIDELSHKTSQLSKECRFLREQLKK